ncbi:putative DNA-binding protein; putative AP2/ERF domain [Methylorubrum extorquens DM4]|uniref:DNA-binding protein putative AP2/ERF domain n=1 Tax=Methylorubrum extorquens (strain DSM 6343 / CIP 106787 / DM4) TaxID=661410 RepID=C7C6Z0_METED|nr:hypothetical protein [Methylorubrum extorquens]CAX21894.1 putative DNA-binding protein; putative AP2/ERF domain [Methylorubrum extorquens DM4]
MRAKRPIRIVGDVAYVTLTRGMTAIIDAEDAERVGAHNRSYCDNGTGYALTSWRNPKTGKDSKLSLHRFVMGVPSQHVDHRHGNTLDCRKAELRVATQRQNMQNRRKPTNNTSGMKGVIEVKPGWFKARVGHEGKSVDLGDYRSVEEAGIAYDVAAHLLFKRFARPNHARLNREGRPRYRNRRSPEFRAEDAVKRFLVRRRLEREAAYAKVPVESLASAVTNSPRAAVTNRFKPAA